MPEAPDRPLTRRAKAREEWHRTSRWKRTLVAISLGITLIGAVLTGYGKFVAAPAPQSINQTPAPRAAESPASSGSSSIPSTPTRGFIDARSAPRSTTADPTQSTARSPTPPAAAEPQADASAPDNLQTFSPALFKLGFSFFAGFCIAFALRIFLRMAIFTIGVVLLAAFALQYFGLVNINWHLIGGHYDSAAQWLSSQFDSFQSFITGQLPSAASALAGGALGFRR